MRKYIAKIYRKWNLLIRLTLVFLLIISQDTIEGYELNKNGIITSGKVTKFRYNSSGNFLINYNYIVENKEYIGYQSVHYFESKDGIEGCVGRKFKIIYSKKNPKISDIDLEEFNNKKFKKLSLISKDRTD